MKSAHLSFRLAEVKLNQVLERVDYIFEASAFLLNHLYSPGGQRVLEG